MIRTLNVIAMSLALVVAGASSALAWHDETKAEGDRYVTTTTREYGPAGDPYHRVTIAAEEVRTCSGYVRIPDQNWVTDDTRLEVQGGPTLTEPGKWYSLAPGIYDAQWQWRFQNGQPTRTEYEKVRVPSCLYTAEVLNSKYTWRVVGKNGVRKMRISVPANCTFKSQWAFHKGSSKAWVWSNTDQRRILTYRAGKAGYYPPLYRGYQKGGQKVPNGWLFCGK